MLLNDSEICELMTPDIVEGEYYLPMQFARIVEAKIEAKLREQVPVAYMNSDSFDKLLSTISCWTLVQKDSDAGFDIPLYTHPAPIPEVSNQLSGNSGQVQIPADWRSIIANFIHQFKRHVGGDGEFWLHELEDFYDKMAARSGEWQLALLI